jgi:hypothetical protein
MVEIAILIILFCATTIIEIKLKSIQKQNDRVIVLLEEIRDQNKNH